MISHLARSDVASRMTDQQVTSGEADRAAVAEDKEGTASVPALASTAVAAAEGAAAVAAAGRTGGRGLGG